jgi:hypothetical protein
MAIQNFTTWTEIDPSSVITVTPTSITVDDMERRDDGSVYKDYGVNHFDGDVSFKFKFTTPASEDSTDSAWIYPLAMVNEANEMGDEMELNSHPGQGIIFLNISGTPKMPLFKVEGGSRTTSYPDDLAWETTYYITFERDDDGGANSTGQLTIRVYTTNYYGEDGAVEHDTATLDCGAGQQVDFQYLQLMFPRGSIGLYPTDALLEDFNDDVEDPTYRDVAFTIAGTSGFSIAADSVVYKDAAFTIAGTSGFSCAAEMIGGTVENYETNQTCRLVVAGNDSIYYEDT